MGIKDKIYCHTTGYYLNCHPKESFAIKGKWYDVVNIRGNNIWFISESGRKHQWEMDHPLFSKYFSHQIELCEKNIKEHKMV
jgi:hypothetical protein